MDNYITDEGNKREEPTKPDTPVVPDEPEDPKDPEPVVPVYPTFNNPQWTLKCSYENTMTVFMQLPDSLCDSSNNNDNIAVLCGDEVRGVLYNQKLSDKDNVWMGMIYGEAREALRIGYYSSTSFHLYYTANTFNFASDTQYGTIDNPMKPGFSIVTQK